MSALLNVFDDIMHLMSGGNTVDMVYLDLAKAFDKVDHGVLLHKIKTLGITGKLGVWLYHFLTHNTHFVISQGGNSHDSTVLSGVPQGTCIYAGYAFSDRPLARGNWNAFQMSPTARLEIKLTILWL